MSPTNLERKLERKNAYKKGAWSSEEDKKLSQYIQIHGAKRWNTVAINSGLNRGGKSCRLRWLNYLKPDIKRGNISEDEENLIIRLHKLLGNRWALIAGRLPGRTDNEIKNYWISHLSKKVSKNTIVNNLVAQHPIIEEKYKFIPKVEKQKESSQTRLHEDANVRGHEEEANKDIINPFDPNDFFYFSLEGTFDLEWVNKFIKLNNVDINNLN